MLNIVQTSLTAKCGYNENRSHEIINQSKIRTKTSQKLKPEQWKKSKLFEFEQPRKFEETRRESPGIFFFFFISGSPLGMKKNQERSTFFFFWRSFSFPLYFNFSVETNSGK